MGKETTNRKSVRKPRVQSTPRIKWTEEMEKSILEFAKDGIAIGRDFEKPTAPDYYKRFLVNNQLPCFENVPIGKLVQHMKNMKKLYNNALEWRNKTGQGILAEDLERGTETVKLELKKRCPYFDELDEILGDKPQFNPPFLHHTDAGDNEEEYSSENETGGVVLNPIGEHDRIEVVIDPPNAGTTPPQDMPPKKKVRKSPIKSAAVALENSMIARVTFEEKRLEWEMAKEERDRLESQSNVQMERDFRQQQLNFEREKWNEEFRRQQSNDERNFELEKLRIEKEMELQKLKIQNDLELEKLKMRNGSSD